MTPSVNKLKPFSISFHIKCNSMNGTCSLTSVNFCIGEGEEKEVKMCTAIMENSVEFPHKIKYRIAIRPSNPTSGNEIGILKKHPHSYVH